MGTKLLHRVDRTRLVTKPGKVPPQRIRHQADSFATQFRHWIRGIVPSDFNSISNEASADPIARLRSVLDRVQGRFEGRIQTNTAFFLRRREKVGGLSV